MPVDSLSKLVRIHSEGSFIAAAEEMARIGRIEDLKYFVGLKNVVISAEEILCSEVEYISHIFSLSLANQAVVKVKMNESSEDEQIANLVLFKFLRIGNLKFVSGDSSMLKAVYIGKTVLPMIVPKPKKYLIADIFWDAFVKIEPLRLIAKNIYHFGLKIKERYL